MAASARAAGQPMGPSWRRLSRRRRRPSRGPPREAQVMGRVAWRKVLRDLWLARGRTAVLVVAMAVSLTVVGAVLGAYGILTREMPRSFQSARPASATLVLDRGIDP